jgi:hypothetical protein
MARFKSKNILVGAAALLMALGLILSGCSTSPTGTENVPDDPQPTLMKRASVATGAEFTPVDLYAEKVISSAKGGTLSLLDVVLEVPAGAVPNDTLFSIFIPDDEVFFNEFGTDGLVFMRPVTVTMSYRDADLTGIDESTIRIGWLNERTGQWHDMECEVDFVNKVVTGQLEHFSAYGLISD